MSPKTATNLIIDVADQLAQHGILDEIFEDGWEHADTRDVLADAEAIVRFVLSASGFLPEEKS